MRLKNVKLMQLDGVTPAPASENISGKGPDLTLARVLTNAALSPDSRGGMAPVQGSDAVARYELAVRLYKTSVDQYFTVDNALIERLTADILRLYAPMISGACIKMFENSTSNGVEEETIKDPA